MTRKVIFNVLEVLRRREQHPTFATLSARLQNLDQSFPDASL